MMGGSGNSLNCDSVRHASVPVLSGESPDEVSANHTPRTELHTQRGNKLGEAERRELLGCNASEGVEPRNSFILDADVLESTEGNIFHAATGEAWKNRRGQSPWHDNTRSWYERGRAKANSYR